MDGKALSAEHIALRDEEDSNACEFGLVACDAASFGSIGRR